jgi:DNA-binding MarR family transcriptional regulator
MRDHPKRAEASDRRGSDAIASRYDTPGASPGFVLWQVASLWQRGVRAALEEVELTHAQFVLLACATWLEAERDEDGRVVTQAIVADQAKTDAVMTSEVLRTLERKALIRRLAHPTDARAKRIVVTAAGRRLARRAITLVEAVDESFFGTPGPELAALARLLCADRS